MPFRTRKHSQSDLRKILFVSLWICVSIYIWAYGMKDPTAKDQKLHSGPTDNQLLLESKEHHSYKLHKLPRDEETPSLSLATKTLPIETESIVKEFEEESEGTSFELALKNKWVGFPQIAGKDCKPAYEGRTKNNKYPQKVKRIRSAQLSSDAQDCKAFRRKYGFIRYPKASEEEKNFPIAFIILFYQDLDQVLFLLRAIYRPHNVVCLSVDTKASIDLLEAVRSVSKCLPNVFVASKLESIVYAGFSRLMADVNCMQDLLKHPVQWKYVFNMPGTQFPLRTNLEMVKILKIYNGANDIEGLTGDMLVADRYQYIHTYVTDEATGNLRVKKIFVPNKPPPHDIQMVKGSTYGTFSRAFVNFTLNEPIAKDFLEWCKTIKSPDEYFWGTLHHSKNIDVPGGFKGPQNKKPWLTSFSLWETSNKTRCATLYVHKICIFSPEDIVKFIHTARLFANKFYITHHPAALHCLDELLVNMTFSGQVRNLEFYRKLPFILKDTPDTS